MQVNIKKLHVQRVFWKPHNKPLLCWVFYYVNDIKEMDRKIPQVMHYIICYNSPIDAFSLIRI